MAEVLPAFLGALCGVLFVALVSRVYEALRARYASRSIRALGPAARWIKPRPAEDGDAALLYAEDGPLGELSEDALRSAVVQEHLLSAPVDRSRTIRVQRYEGYGVEVE